MHRAIFIFFLFVSFHSVAGQTVKIRLDVPEIDTATYHRPYVAVWLESSGGEPIETVALWVDQEDWLKDLRRWWRKLGRRNWKKSAQLDAVTGATRRPGTYTVKWKANNIELDEFVLHIEAARERGGRSHVTKMINLSAQQEYVIEAEEELGEIRVSVSGL